LGDVVASVAGSVPDLASLVVAAAGEPGSRLPRLVSPVLLDWFTAWGTVLGEEDRRGLARYVQPLARSWGSTDVELYRQWLVLDWAFTVAVPAR
jgi:hypothetical protein